MSVFVLAFLGVALVTAVFLAVLLTAAFTGAFLVGIIKIPLPLNNQTIKYANSRNNSLKILIEEKQCTGVGLSGFSERTDRFLKGKRS
jgi:hypothetical protein